MKNISLQRTNLEWDNYINYLIEAIDESNFMKRAEDKSMQSPRLPLESHITSRAAHVRAAADIAKRIAEGLGLNADFIYAAMLMHDAGHPFTAHDGEEMFTGIGITSLVDYFHHNAKGVEVVISENICEKAISKIPNINMKPELKKKLEEEFYYFLDVIISHDGEAEAKELNAKPKEYKDIKTAVFEKLRLSNSENDYKFIAQTPEGRIAKYADVIAYLSTDIQDRFRLGIQNDFDDDYLELIGELLSKDFIGTREEKIEIAKKIIEEVKNDKLMKLVSDARAEENKDIIVNADNIIDKIHSIKGYEGMSPEQQEKVIEEVTNQYIEDYKEKNNYNNMKNEEKNFFNADLIKIREFAKKKLNIRNSVVEKITSDIKEVMINDLLRESTSKDQIVFSDRMKKMFFKAKEINYRYVPYTKLNYLKNDLPIATEKMVKMIALDLRKSGAIAAKFYDRSMRKHVKDKKALKWLKILGSTDDNEYAKYRKKRRIIDRAKAKINKFTSAGGRRRSKFKAMGELSNAAYHYVLGSGELFAIQYENTFKAVQNQIKLKVQSALGKTTAEQNKKRTTDIEYFDKKIKRQDDKVRKQIIKEYGSINITEKQEKEFTDKLIKKELRKMEGKMATQCAINYLAGISDRAIQEHAIDMGFMTKETKDNAKRGATADDRKKFSEKYNTNVDDSNEEKTNKLETR